MANNEVRTCPKCGMNLGQRHLCPVCDKTEENAEPAPNPNADAGGDAALAVSRTAEYVSRVIEFIGEHPDNWDDEFNAFFDGLAGDHEYMACHDACSKVGVIFREPVSGRISGCRTIKCMQDLKTIFPDLSDKEARLLALKLLEKCAEVIPLPLPPLSSSEAHQRYRDAVERNDISAQVNLGLRFSHSFFSLDPTLDENWGEAVKWYRKAAVQGDRCAQFYLGRCYEDGKGVSKDLTEAVKWYRKSAEQGEERARKRLDKLGK